MAVRRRADVSIGWAARLMMPFVVSVCVPPQHVAAQEFRGRVQSETTNEPLGGALIMLLDSNGRVRTATLAGSEGHFHIAAPGEGEYYLQAERIGFGKVTAGPVSAGANQIVQISFLLPLEPIPLDEIAVVGERRCEVRPREGLLAHQLWERAATALRGAAVAQDQELIEYTVTTYERDVSLVGGSLQTRREAPRRVRGRPFATLSPEELAAGGYVQVRGDTVEFHGPSAHVLLSDAFLDAHCLRVELEGADREGLIGIGFDPVSERSVPDISGVIWLDAVTGALQHVTYRYTGLSEAWLAHAGGRIEFRAAWERCLDRAALVDQDAESGSDHGLAALGRAARSACELRGGWWGGYFRRQTRP